jgi:hypothetical protein
MHSNNEFVCVPSDSIFRTQAKTAYLQLLIVKLRLQHAMPPPYPPSTALLWEWLVAPIILIVMATLPWSMFLLAGYLAAWFFDRFLAEHLARRHEPVDQDHQRTIFPDGQTVALAMTSRPGTTSYGAIDARSTSLAFIHHERAGFVPMGEKDLQSSVPAS